MLDLVSAHHFAILCLGSLVGYVFGCIICSVEDMTDAEETDNL
jgi:hypothetical protein